MENQLTGLQLDGLSEGELKQCQAKIKLLLETSLTEDTDSELLLEAAAHLVFGSGHPPLSILRQQAMYKDFREGMEVFLAFFHKHLPSADPRDRSYTFSILLQMISRFQLERGVTANLRTLGQGMFRIHEVIQWELPGYLDAGLLNKIVRRHG